MKDYIEERAIGESYGKTDCEEIWGVEIYGTYGSNDIERFMWVVR